MILVFFVRQPRVIGSMRTVASDVPEMLVLRGGLYRGRTSLWIFMRWVSDFQDFQSSFRCLGIDAREDGERGRWRFEVMGHDARTMCRKQM